MADPYAQLLIGGRNDQMTQKLKKRHFKQKKDYAAWVKQMRAQGYIVDATQTAYKETKDGELDEVMSYDQFKAGKKLKNETALQETRTLLDSQKLTAKATEKLKDGKANVKDLTKANALYDRDSDDPKGAVPFDIAGKLGLSIGEGTLVGDKLISSGTNFSQTASKGDTEFQPDGESLTGGKAQESLKISERDKWLKKTANSPAAKAWGNSEEAKERRWQLQLKHRKWLKDNNRG